MRIYPAIDLKNGQCVRLTKGDFDTAKIYESDPVKQAKAFMDAGSGWLHMVDLDGAKAGTMQQFDIIADVIAKTGMKVQAGGGIRDEAVIRKLLDAGLQRVVIGSLAVKDVALVKSWLQKFGASRFLLAFDVNVNKSGTPEVATHGWQSGSGVSLWDIIAEYASVKLDSIMCTDIALDGMLQGPNTKLYQSIRERLPHLTLIASGGVSGMKDLVELSKTGVEGVIVGKAIYEGRIDLKTAMDEVRHAS